MTLTPADVKRWDPEAIHGVFQTATNRASSLQTLGDNLQQVHLDLSEWHGESGDAFRADLGKTRRDIEADGNESRLVAAAVSRAEADVRAVKAELDSIEQSAHQFGFTITSDWRIDAGGAKLENAKLLAQQQLEATLSLCRLHAHSADEELAAAIRSAVGEVPDGVTSAPLGSGEPKTLEDMLLPTGPARAQTGGDPANGPPISGDAAGGVTPSLEDMMLGRGEPASPKGPSGDPLELLSRIPPANGGVAPPPLKPAEVESFKAMARQTMINDGVPPEQIEAKLDAVVANTQQWLNAGAPNYVAPEAPRPPAPGFGEGFGDRWFAMENAIHDLTGQNGTGAMGDAWGGMAKGLATRAEELARYGPLAPVNDLTHEVKSFLDNPAYYAGGKTADGAIALPGMMFGPETLGLRAGLGEATGLDAASGVARDLPGSGHSSGLVEAPEGFAGHPSEQPGLPMHSDPPHTGADHTPLDDKGNNRVPDELPHTDSHHADSSYAVDNEGHYLPGSLPSYDDLRELTSTDPNRAFYWSGRNAEGVGVGPDDSGIAELIAHGSGGTTLEMTLEENGIHTLPVWNRHDPVSIQVWEDASAAYAENAQGEVTAIVGTNLRPGNVWQTVEIPRLMENPEITRIVQIDPDTGRSTTIFER